ncbi:single-stranded DNA-binding protein [Streptomyces sp. NRRL B-24484]|uniref:single-stranded DNA-binding protein n=1 Tax=Streptomyces sp. NRRL B-24484 TaxID=1463833 RepID=UPI0004C1815E|nr:hypothetical protein [Streptomyces sp. NRRL B-24484]
MSTTETVEPPDVGVRLDVQFHRRSPTLLVLQATVVLPWGREQFALAMPTAPQGSAAWQCAQIALYLHTVREGAVEPGAAALRDFLIARPSAPTFVWDYRREPLHDRRVECLLNLVVEPHSKGVWPGASLVVIECERGPAGFYRKRSWGGAREIAREALGEIEGERDALLALSNRLKSPALTSLAEDAAALADQVALVWQAVHGDEQRAHAKRARAAVRGAAAVEPEEQTTILLSPEAPLVLNGTIAHVSQVEDKGEKVTRLLLEPDKVHREDLAAVPGQLMCRLEGRLADQAARSGLQPGDRVAVCGRLEVRHYRASDGIPRSGLVLAAEGFGFGAFTG